MKIVILVENTNSRKDCIAEHGLSIYVETDRHRLLMDLGQTDAVIHNAARLQVDLRAVDTVILSHGHYDHSGGLLPFCRLNRTAQIWMQEKAAVPHYHGDRYIGIAPAILSLPNVRMIQGDRKLDEELFLFSGITGRRCFPQGNKRLSMLMNGVKVQDDFLHEQCLVITQGDRRWLLSGCAHNGILNILDRYAGLYGTMPDYVISGFHMMKRGEPYCEEETKVILETAEKLSEYNTVFYSGHCTGETAFDMMKEIMGDRLQVIRCGMELDFPPES